jgi:hypothetical protein
MRTQFVDLETTEIVMSTTSLSGNAGSSRSLLGPARIPLVPLGIALSAFFAISYTLCILLGLVTWDWGLHQPWLQFFPGFTWLTWPSFFLGLAESIAYGWYTALVFGGLYNLALARFGPAR